MLIAVYLALMVIGVIGIFVCRSKQKTNPNAQSVAVIFTIVTLVGAGGLIYDQFAGGDREMDQIMKNEASYAKARSLMIAEYAGKNWAGQTAVIIVEPNTEKNQINKACLDALKEGLKKANISATEEVLDIQQGTGEDSIPIESAINAKIYNDIFNKNKNANIFFLLSQLPLDAKEKNKMKCWEFNPKKTRLVLVLNEVEDLKSLQPIIAKGLIGAAVITKSGFDPEKPAAKDWKEAFDSRYELLTPESVKK